MGALGVAINAGQREDSAHDAAETLTSNEA